MVVFTGKTVEAAIEAGLTSLGLSRSQVTITVLSKEKKGFLGLFGNKPAQVDLAAHDEGVVADQPLPETSPVAQPVERPTRVEPISVDASPTLGPQTESSETDDFDAFVAQEFQTDTYNAQEAGEDVKAYVEKIIYEMDLEATVVVTASRRHMSLQIDTPEPGRLIGYHGKVLKSLQLLAQNYLHDRYSRHYSVSLNVHDYLEHRTGTLIDLATKAAHRVMDTGNTYRMDPMTNSERKIIHKTISRMSGVESYSEGDDPNRYVVIVPRDRY